MDTQFPRAATASSLKDLCCLGATTPRRWGCQLVTRFGANNKRFDVGLQIGIHVLQPYKLKELNALQIAFTFDSQQYKRYQYGMRCAIQFCC